jgi:hypothetical protein
MGNRRLFHCLVCPVLALAAGTGCQSLYSYRPVAVQAVDAETKKPIPGADIVISYPLTRPSQAPYCSEGATGADGIARLRAAPYGEIGVLVEANANGYMNGKKSLSAAEVKAIEPAHFFEKVEGRPATIVLALYAEPTPALELVLPPGYHGLVKVQVDIKDELQSAPGQRLFTGTASKDGLVQVTVPELFHHVVIPVFQLKYPDGPLLPARPENLDVGFWHVKTLGNTYTLLVGTKFEYDEYRRDRMNEEKSEKRSSGGDGGGRGRGGRKGRGGMQGS